MKIVGSFKQASQKAETFAQKKQLREAVITAETALSDWAEKPSLWERLLAKVLIGNLVEKLESQLVEWRKHLASADQLAIKAQGMIKNDVGNPGETQILAAVISLYQRYCQILYDPKISKTLEQYQRELQRRLRFQELVNQGNSQIKSLFFQKGISIYQDALKLYPLDSVQKSIINAQTQVPQEQTFQAAVEKAQQAETEEKLRSAIHILETAVTNFPRIDGVNLLKKLKSKFQGREKFRQGLKAEKRGDFTTAKTLYTDAKSLLPDFPDCQIRLGLIAIKTQNWQQAISDLENVPGEQAAYLRGFAFAQQGILQSAYREWQNISNSQISQQQEIIKEIAQRQRLVCLQNIEELVKYENLELAKTASQEFIHKFGFEPVVETNLDEHIQPRLAAAAWQNHNYQFTAQQAKNEWMNKSNMTTLHNWAVANYYLAQSSHENLLEFIISLATAIANITTNPHLQDVPWLGGKNVDFNALSLELKRRLESAIDKVKDIDIATYLNLRDYCRLELVALKFMGEPVNSGMLINNLFITPGCYQSYRECYELQNIKTLEKIAPYQKILHALYSPWGLAVAACLEVDIERAILLKPSIQPTTEIENFAVQFVAYYEGCFYLQKQNWPQAMIPLQQAKAEVQNNQDWQQEIDRLCSLQRQAISEFSEHLEFAQFWYDVIATKSARSYLAEFKAEELHDKLFNQQVSTEQALQNLKIISRIDENNPVVIALVEKLEINQELEEIDKLFKNHKLEEMKRKAQFSKHDRIRYIVADIFMDILVNGIKNGDLNDPEIIYKLGGWAYELCPDESAFQEIYTGLGLC
ncbi:peptidase M, neutral zinc metallopeptidase site [Dolichospermum sp. UHCC 0259]|uniref:peptidase M, neutral zinc metallopeptidase site n=1 Tax=Dolichospermum sp. UHCC 0259 TaxID=2590010 RepID=UPI001446F88C|nr:peptidase M, neutral zinc metallopeptidase site [Dolichospermum sp. UHCC 0259]MTJ47630.1 peptidase M, neutral zinc metallopeptidase site [Dolichospermum sp. UHCC 0259]